jgi:MqsR (Motility quorum-sensing regulator) toxin of toxin-antitoxin system
VTPRWLPRVLRRIQELVDERKVSFTLKARRELAALEFGLDGEDACELLASLTTDDWAGRVASRATGEWLYVFKPELAGVILYVKLILRLDCIVVSFHEDAGGHEEDA